MDTRNDNRPVAVKPASNDQFDLLAVAVRALRDAGRPEDAKIMWRAWRRTDDDAEGLAILQAFVIIPGVTDVEQDTTFGVGELRRGAQIAFGEHCMFTVSEVFIRFTDEGRLEAQLTGIWQDVGCRPRMAHLRAPILQKTLRMGHAVVQPLRATEAMLALLEQEAMK